MGTLAVAVGVDGGVGIAAVVDGVGVGVADGGVGLAAVDGTGAGDAYFSCRDCGPSVVEVAHHASNAGAGAGSDDGGAGVDDGGTP